MQGCTPHASTARMNLEYMKLCYTHEGPTSRTMATTRQSIILHGNATSFDIKRHPAKHCSTKFNLKILLGIGYGLEARVGHEKYTARAASRVHDV